MKKKGNQPVILTKLSAWDKAQHRRDLGFSFPNAFTLLVDSTSIPESQKQYELEERFEKTFGGE